LARLLAATEACDVAFVVALELTEVVAMMR
jgi:hypothetical protein